MNPDPLDNANEMTELFLRAAMSNRPQASLKPVGQCHYCTTEVRAGLLFCPGGDCAKDWEREEKIRKINGSR